ncbi:MAG TPA: DUF1080 domain-containing protein [bacterium]|nr:DUF1080 domain-containing protein [bacterium]HPN45066.1 DUF1080 domain-containing protein [bacterium]
MYIIMLFLIPAALAVSAGAADVELPVNHHPAADVYDGWKLGSQAYTFNRFTFYEALDKIASLGLHWVEAYPGQALSTENPEAKMIHTMSPELQEQVKQQLAVRGLQLLNYGVVNLPNNEAECRQVFDFAKNMGIETIVAEPPEDAFELIDKLCQEYKIKVAIHNHPEPSHYWNPETVLKVCKDRSKWIGACGDTGHWMRSGIHPVEALRKLQGRIISMHLKDLNEFGNKEAHDVVWGTGKADIKAILAELHKQKFAGAFSIEYEYNWDNSLPEIRPSVAYFNTVAAALKPSGWKNLFADDLTNAQCKEGTWTVGEGVLTWHGGDYIWTRDKYGDFILDLEFKVSAGANSGIFFRTGDLANYVHTGIEVQVHETTDGTKYGMCGAIYDCMPPAKTVVKPAGEWNRYTITCKANKIYVVMNGEQIIAMDLNKWTEKGKNPDGTDNKFETAYKDMPRSGYIGFQDHGQPVWFRNIKIKSL